MKRSYAKQYFFSLGFRYGAEGGRLLSQQEHKVSWPMWCRVQWTLGWFEGHDSVWQHRNAKRAKSK